MECSSQVLVFEAAQGPAGRLHERLHQCGIPSDRRLLADAGDGPAWKRPEIAVIVLGDTASSDRAQHVAALLERLAAEQVATLVWGPSDNVRGMGGASVEWLDPGASLDEIVGRLSTLRRYVPFVRRMERELEHMHRLGDQLNRYFGEIDQEMRLAGRLQRDFLPQSLPEVPGLQFAVVYRPASWVSGDMYDVFPIDQRHIGLFVGDAMGHGVAAGLITMFIRQALLTRRVTAAPHAVLSPAQALVDLHDCLIRQRLPNCQFVTATYAILDTQDWQLRVARGGHPYPLHVTKDGTINLIAPGGGLLGLQDVTSDFEEVCVPLRPADKVILYTDGVDEDFFADPGTPSDYQEWTELLRALAARPIHGFASALSEHLDGKAGSLHPADDVTVLAVELTPPPANSVPA